MLQSSNLTGVPQNCVSAFTLSLRGPLVGSTGPVVVVHVLPVDDDLCLWIGVLTYSTTISIVDVVVTACPCTMYLEICSNLHLFTILAAGNMTVISAKYSVDKSEPLLTPAAIASVISSGIIPANLAMVNSIFL